VAAATPPEGSGTAATPTPDVPADTASKDNVSRRTKTPVAGDSGKPPSRQPIKVVDDRSSSLPTRLMTHPTKPVSLSYDLSKACGWLR
jgi:hypothetical protein